LRRTLIVTRPSLHHPEGAKEGVMNVEYAVQIDDRIHRIRIEIPAFCEERELKQTREFAIVTALLEHAGYLPAGTVHAVA